MNARDDLLMVVDEHDEILGYEPKARCHQGQGLLHRAFSIFLFNDRRQLLLQQRSQYKLLWPLYWSNSVCSHPRQGESYAAATQRRLGEELGIQTEVRFAFKFCYHAAFKEIGVEHELCSVYLGEINAQRIQANAQEIAAWNFVDAPDLTAALATHPEQYTPWFKIEWQRLLQTELCA